MINIENDCVGCELPCLGDACPYSNVPHYYCDKCGDEAEELRNYYGDELCFYCWREEVEDELKAEYEKLNLVVADDD